MAQRGIFRHDWLKGRQGVQLPRTRDCSPAPSPISWLSAAPALQRSMTHCGDTAAPRGGLPYVIAQCSSQPLPSFHDPCFELDRRFRRSMASAVARPNAMRLSRPSLSARLLPIRSGGRNTKGKGGYRGTRAGYESGREVSVYTAALGWHRSASAEPSVLPPWVGPRPGAVVISRTLRKADFAEGSGAVALITGQYRGDGQNPALLRSGWTPPCRPRASGVLGESTDSHIEATPRGLPC